ncbi:MAG: hypothetical protein AYP45_12070 [Candidatus Brocadia carolinensis]|uniref:Uncharacterized protein n=1 Tax=Candidatus Brocadia carolinensis TaxID=1004156 RepID=A0A1V4ARZ4_9BACT|nr:MAG: hypothetical protein AYP45_12070 [Candidatus Brocadia caroliniensis]
MESMGIRKGWTWGIIHTRGTEVVPSLIAFIAETKEVLHSTAKPQPVFSVVKAGDCFGKDPCTDTGYAFDDIVCVVIVSTFALLRINSAKQSFPHKQSVPSDNG